MALSWRWIRRDIEGARSLASCWEALLRGSFNPISTTINATGEPKSAKRLNTQLPSGGMRLYN